MTLCSGNLGQVEFSQQRDRILTVVVVVVYRHVDVICHLFLDNFFFSYWQSLRVRAASTVVKWARSLINHERSKGLQDSSLATWLRHNLNWTKTFWVVSKRRSFKLGKTNLLAEGQEKYCTTIPPSSVYIRNPAGASPVVPGIEEGITGAFQERQARHRADTVLEELCRRGGIGRMCY